MVDGHAQVVVRRQQALLRRDDAVAVVIGVAGKRDVELVLEAYQALHGVRRRRVHADLAVPVQGHEAEGRVDHRADHRQVEPPALGDGCPVVDAGAAHRIDAHAQLRIADGIQVDHAAEVANVVRAVVVAVRRGRLQCLRMRHAAHTLQAAFEIGVGGGLDRTRDRIAGRSAVRWVVLEAAVARRVVRRRDDDAVSAVGLTRSVVVDDGVRDRWCRRGLVVGRQHHVDAVGRQHFECAGAGRCRQRVRVDAQEQRPADAQAPALIADRLRDRQHMPFVEGHVECSATMTRGAKSDALRSHRRVRPFGPIGRDELGHVDELGRCGRLPGQRADAADGRDGAGHGKPQA